MTKEEAIELMKAGELLTHPYLLPQNYITITSRGNIISESNLVSSQEDFWKYRKAKGWKQDWEIFLGEIV